MELTPLSNLVIALVVLLTMLAVYIIYLIRARRDDAEKGAYFLYFEMIRRADLIPHFIELAKAENLAVDFTELIENRSKTMNIEQFDQNKKSAEETLWKNFDQTLAQIKTAISKNGQIQVAVLEKDWRDATSRVNNMTAQYNRLVGKYNKLANNIILKPLSLLVKAPKMSTF